MRMKFIVLLTILSVWLVACASPAPPPTSVPVSTIGPTPVGVDPIFNEDGKISGWNSATDRLTVQKGRRFEYWLYPTQKWIEFEVLETYPFELGVPSPSIRIFDDPMFEATNRMVVGVDDRYASSGVLVYFWVEGLRDSLTIRTPGKVLRPIQTPSD